MRRRFNSGIKSGIYAVNKNGILIPISEADTTCIAVALVSDGHKLMIEKNEDSNQSYKNASAGYNKSYLFYWGGYGTDQIGITNYSNLYGNNIIGYLKPESGSYNGTPYSGKCFFMDKWGFV